MNGVSSKPQQQQENFEGHLLSYEGAALMWFSVWYAGSPNHLQRTSLSCIATVDGYLPRVSPSPCCELDKLLL